VGIAFRKIMPVVLVEIARERREKLNTLAMFIGLSASNLSPK
jgi:hypothetical protein